MSFKRYRIIFILIFMFANGCFGFDDDQTTNNHPHKDESSHSGNFFQTLFLSDIFLKNIFLKIHTIND